MPEPTLGELDLRVRNLEAWRVSAAPVVEVAEEIQQTLLPFLRELVRERQYADYSRSRAAKRWRRWQVRLAVVGGVLTVAALIAGAVLQIVRALGGG